MDGIEILAALSAVCGALLLLAIWRDSRREKAEQEERAKEAAQRDEVRAAQRREAARQHALADAFVTTRSPAPAMPRVVHSRVSTAPTAQRTVAQSRSASTSRRRDDDDSPASDIWDTLRSSDDDTPSRSYSCSSPSYDSSPSSSSSSCDSSSSSDSGSCSSGCD